MVVMFVVIMLMSMLWSGDAYGVSNCERAARSLGVSLQFNNSYARLRLNCK
jgi:hypothetical protein